MRSIIFILLVILMGCNKEQFGSKPSSPELTSRYFFEAIYVHKDIQKAKEYVSQPIWDIISHYHIASSIQKYLLNLSMSDVSIEIEDVDADFFRKFTSTTTVVVKLTGKKNDQKWIDTRTVKIRLNEQDKWEIYQIVTERMR